MHVNIRVVQHEVQQIFLIVSCDTIEHLHLLRIFVNKGQTTPLIREMRCELGAFALICVVVCPENLKNWLSSWRGEYLCCVGAGIHLA